MNNNYYFNIKKKRPEETYDKVTDYYRGDVLKSYASSKSMIKIQEKLTIRALELLDLRKKEALILDAGCGPGFTAMYLNEIGFKSVALDIIGNFLRYYDISSLNPVNADMCFTPFKPNTFDAIISISALQWVYRDFNNKSMLFFLKNLSKSFFHILKPNTRVIFQFYPKSKMIMENIGKIIADNTDFTGNFIIDNPNRQKKRKIYLLLDK
ncbi:MAG: class I SAM-dependent methyltransferase [Promethearchaeota archaeon]